MSITSRTIRTEHADIAFLETSGKGMPVLLVHGNSSCKEVFRAQLESEAGETYRMIALDLPGHGRSGDAFDPVRSYSIPGYADLASELLHRLDIPRAAVFGWSLGGHVGLEMLHRYPGLAGLMIVGAPPFARGLFGMMRAFNSQFDLMLATRAKLTPREIRRFARVCLGEATAAHFLEAIERTDTQARPLLFRAMMRGDGADQKRMAEQADVPLAIVNGSEEPFARLGHVAGLSCPTLWEQTCHVIEGAGHAPFLQAPEAFNALFRRFLDDTARSERIDARDVRRLTA